MTSNVYTSSSNNRTPSAIVSSGLNVVGDGLLINGLIFIGSTYLLYVVFFKH